LTPVSSTETEDCRTNAVDLSSNEESLSPDVEDTLNSNNRSDHQQQKENSLKLTSYLSL
jgi:hypothetical protein